jgi:nucleoside-diphosphate-sugar epimerase
MSDSTDAAPPTAPGTFNVLRGARALVTGGAGFIGSHLADALIKHGAEVVVLDNLDGGSGENVPQAARFIQGSILDSDVVASASAGCQYVFHLAALGSVPRSVAEPRRFHDVNVTGTLNVLEAARTAGVKRVMFAASSSAYGDSEVLPKVESMVPTPRSPYAANKVACEAMLQAYAACYDVDAVSLRYFNIFGPRQNANSAYAAVIAAFAKAMLAGRRPTVYGDGEQSRDFTYVANAVHANLLAATRPNRLGGEVLNVGCARAITVNELAGAMATALGRPELGAPVYESPRAGDVKHSLADLSLTSATLGYLPVVSFEDGLRKTMDWYRVAGV